MAYPSTEAIKFRDRASRFVESLRDLDSILAVVEDHGITDAERQAFFSDVFTVDSDITWTEFAEGVIALRNLRTAWDTNKIAIAKLLR